MIVKPIREMLTLSVPSIDFSCSKSRSLSRRLCERLQRPLQASALGRQGHNSYWSRLGSYHRLYWRTCNRHWRALHWRGRCSRPHCWGPHSGDCSLCGNCGLCGSTLRRCRFRWRRLEGRRGCLRRRHRGSLRCRRGCNWRLRSWLRRCCSCRRRWLRNCRRRGCLGRRRRRQSALNGRRRSSRSVLHWRRWPHCCCGRGCRCRHCHARSNRRDHTFRTCLGAGSVGRPCHWSGTRHWLCRLRRGDWHWGWQWQAWCTACGNSRRF